MASNGASYVIDIVCGAVIDLNDAAHRSRHEDKTYSFCSTGCQRVFDDDPEEYLKARAYGSTRKEKKMAMQAIDPVCNMTVNPEKTLYKYEYRGETYYFCSPGCKKAFETKPTTYLRKNDRFR